MIHFDQKLAPSCARPEANLAQLGALLSKTPRSISPLTGGYSTVNCEVITASGEHAVMRWRPGDARTLDVELAVAAHASDRVTVPRVIERGTDWALLSWVEGARIDRLLEDSSNQVRWTHVTYACGQAVAALHEIRFDTSGFLSRTCQVAEELGSAGSGLRGSMQTWLDDEAIRQRLGEGRTRGVDELLSGHEPLWIALDRDGARLVHSDFNTKNLIARHEHDAWHVTLLDWEYAFAGSRFMDLGNFLRFESERPDAAAAFIQGYREQAPLPDAWRAMAHLCDLCSMISMMTREDLSARTRETVLGVIDQIILAVQ